MAIPPQASIREALLIELLRAGGAAKPGDLYEKVSAHFKELTPDDLARELPCGHNVFNNRVQWTRQQLVEEGRIDKSKRGVWQLTQAGREEASSFAPRTNASAAAPNLLELIQSHESELRAQLRTFLFAMLPKQFEQLSARLLRAMGFREVKVTQYSGDGGIDGHGSLKVGIVAVKAAFQSKRWKRAIGRPEIDAFRGATQGKFDQAIYLATSTFTEQARDASVRAGCIPVIMVDGDEMVALMIEHGIGVNSRPLTIPQLDEDFFAEMEQDDGARAE